MLKPKLDFNGKQREAFWSGFFATIKNFGLFDRKSSFGERYFWGLKDFIPETGVDPLDQEACLTRQKTRGEESAKRNQDEIERIFG